VLITAAVEEPVYREYRSLYSRYTRRLFTGSVSHALRKARKIGGARVRLSAIDPWLLCLPLVLAEEKAKIEPVVDGGGCSPDAVSVAIKETGVEESEEGRRCCSFFCSHSF
jgi:hypothetical protein